MPKTQTLVALALAASAAYGVHRWTGSAEPADRGQRVTDRFWLDHIPQGERDTAQIFVLLSKETAGQQVGIFEARSMWRGAFEAFRYDTKKNVIVATFPHTGETEEYTATASRCDKNGMDFCLKLDGGTHGTHEYYSRTGWEIEGATSVAEITARAQTIEASH